MNTLVGQNIEQNYSIDSNGTLSVQDNYGDNFSLYVIGYSSAGTSTTTTFLGNSTYIVANHLTMNGLQQVSNVSISFIVHKQFCNPSGMEVVIQGNSATTSNNTISFQFKERPTSFGQSVVWFDNGQLNPVIAPNAQNNSSTGTSATSPAHLASLGFSWADSANLNPVFNNATETLTYQVSSQNFTIDPIVVGGSSYPYATSNDYGGHTCEAAGRYWVFYVNATNSPVYQSSTDGSVWSTPTSFGSSGIAGNIQGGFSVYCSGANVYYAGSSDSSLTYSFIIGQGSMGSNGAVTWSHAPYTLSTPNAGVSDPSITADSNGNVWAAVTEVYPSTRLDVYKCTSSESGCTYSNSLTGNAAYPPELVPLTNGKMALLFGGSGIVVDEYSGTSWSSGPTTSHSVSLYYSSAVAIGDTIELGASDGTNVYYYIFAYGGSSWSSGVTVGQGHYAGISGDDNNRLVVSYISGSSVEYVYSTASGLYWSDPVIVSSSETSPEFISASFAIDSGMFQAAWTDTGTSNYDVKFVSLPSVIPNAATSGKPWSKPGLSPFQDYFTHISEYVSPGNGLLGISQTDYSLTGRNGLDLAITRVYSTPYSFSTGNKTFNYDNFTLSNLGAGWSLDFPWLGQYFVHVGEGQAYAYNWTGSVFLNTRGQPFKLSNNSGSSFDLYLASGVDYHFDSLKRLVSITDTTGNNTLTLEYNSNSYISNITDSVGRIIKFIYSGSTSQLSTIITGEGNFTYAYSGSDLVSVTDPMNHVTKYYYKTGLNSWLVSSITYPTGAYTNYTYAGAPVGTGVMTYYATSQSVYISSGNLDRSTQYNYDITNGQINSCNTTVADGSGTNQSRINYVFSGTSSKQTQVQEYANKTIILQYESDFDATGRINESKTLSPTNTVLAYSVTHYDNWSNVVFTQNEIGQKTWYSYANTNTTNTFTDGASGFTNSFYANNTVISSNIHDLLVGEAQYQNGQGTNKSETYYNYNSAGELIHQKQLHNGSWLVSSYTYDHYGNKLTATDPLGRTTYYQYSSTYDYAYPTQQSIIVSGDVQGNGGASGSISLDGSASARCVNVVTCSTSLSTSKSPDVIVVTAVDQASDTINTPTDTAGLTWTLRKSVVNGGLHSYYWYAIATGSLSSDSISVTASASCVIALTAFGISGANTASPFDSNSGLPASATGSSTSPSVTISTSNANDMLLGIPAAVGSATVSAGTGFTQIKTSTSPGTGDEYEIVSALQSSSSVGSTLSASENWAMIGDAIVQASSASGGSQNVSTTYTYNFTTGLQLSVTDPNGHTTNYAYDKIGRLTATIYPLVNQVASETKYFYNDAGNYMTTTDPNGNNVTNYFDGLERSVRVVTYNGSSVYSTQNYTYNYLDLKSSYTTANGNTTQYSYDALGFQTKVTNPDGTSSTASYNYQNNTVTATDEDGHKTIYAYDWTKKDLLWVREYNSSSSYYL
ncbi:MAG TPA: hypothetical protein VFF30_05650, partial [Nitrososphaerales archaeon]|nr:hypothetical protein [Nitrososphaerales archaeon]